MGHERPDIVSAAVLPVFSRLFSACRASHTSFWKYLPGNYTMREVVAFFFPPGVDWNYKKRANGKTEAYMPSRYCGFGFFCWLFSSGKEFCIVSPCRAKGW
jgi:hypothetical protein